MLVHYSKKLLLCASIVAVNSTLLAGNVLASGRGNKIPEGHEKSKGAVKKASAVEKATTETPLDKLVRANALMNGGKREESYALYESLYKEKDLVISRCAAHYLGVRAFQSKEYNTAIRFLTEAMQNEYKQLLPHTKMQLAQVLDLTGLPQNQECAFRYFNELFDAYKHDENSPYFRTAKLCLASCLERGKGCKPDIEKSRLYYRELANMGIPQAQVKVSEFLYAANQNLVEAYRLCDKAAQAGCIEGMSRQSFYLSHGIGCDIDDDRAFKLAKTARERGDSLGARVLGRLLIDGRGCKANLEQGIDALIFAAQHGDTQASSILGLIPKMDKCPHNGKQAVALLTFEHEQKNDMNAVLSLANIYMSGSLVEQDLKRALFYFQKLEGLVLTRGSTKCSVYSPMGFIYHKLGDYSNALLYYMLAHQEGDKISNSLMKYLIKKISSLEKNKRRAPTKNENKDLTIEEQQKELKTVIEVSNSLFAKLNGLLQEMTPNEEMLGEQRLNLSQERTFCERFEGAFQANINKELDEGFKLLDKIKKCKDIIALLKKKIASIKDAKGKMFLAEQELKNKLRNDAERKRFERENVIFSPFEVSTKPDTSTREVKQNAKEQLQKEQNRQHERTMKQPAEDTRKPVQLKEEKPPVERAPRPYQNITIEENATEIKKELMRKAVLIKEAIEASENMFDAIHNLKMLDFATDLKVISLKYSGIPDGDLAFQIAINDKLRVVFAFKKVQVLKPIVNINNDNNAVNQNEEYEDVYSLVKNSIFIKNPHKG